MGKEEGQIVIFACANADVQQMIVSVTRLPNMVFTESLFEGEMAVGRHIESLKAEVAAAQETKSSDEEAPPTTLGAREATQDCTMRRWTDDNDEVRSDRSI